MAIQSWPSSVFMDLMQIESASFVPFRQREMSRAKRGTIYTKELAPTLWTATFTSVPLDHATAEQVEALIGSMEDQLGTFYAYNPRLTKPQADQTGALLGAAAPKIASINADRKRVAVKSLPAGYVLTRGDRFHSVTTGGKQAMFQIVDATATADGSGTTAQFEVTPGLRATFAMAVNDFITLIKPTCIMVLIPDTMNNAAEGDDSRISFQAIEAP